MTRNQCGGCMAGYPITRKDGMHRLPNGLAFMCCGSCDQGLPCEESSEPTPSDHADDERRAAQGD